MKLKTLNLFRTILCAGLTSLMLIAASCTKQTEDNTPAKADSVYLPVVIYNTVRLLDSFVYNSDNTVSKMFYGYTPDSYHERVEFTYDNEGRCKRMGYFRLDRNLTERYDSLVYGANGEVVLSRRYGVGSNFDHTLRLKLNNDGALVHFSMDSALSSHNYTKAFDWNMIITAGNLTQYDNKRLTDGLAEGQLLESSSSTRFTYDQRPNSLKEFFRKNPVVQILLGYDQSSVLLYNGSTNNVNTVSISDNNAAYKTYSAENTYDEKTGLLIKQVFTNNNTEWITSSVSYKKVAAK